MPELDLMQLRKAIAPFVPQGRAGLLPALHAAQSLHGWISEPVAAEIGRALSVPLPKSTSYATRSWSEWCHLWWRWIWMFLGPLSIEFQELGFKKIEVKLQRPLVHRLMAGMREAGAACAGLSSVARRNQALKSTPPIS